MLTCGVRCGCLRSLPLQQVTDALPMLQHIVTAVGYPVGGENLSVTRGVVSRIDLLECVAVCSNALPLN